MNLSQNDTLRDLITGRIKLVFEKQAPLIKDAGERGMVIDTTRLSKYLKAKSGGLTDDQVLWIATRLGIQVHLNFGTPVIKGDKLEYKILKYDEAKCLQRLKKIFGR